MRAITLSELREQMVALSMSFFYQVLIIIIFFDVVTGVAKAIKQKRVNSKIGINGIIRHMVVIMIQTIVGLYSRVLGVDIVSYGLCVSFIGFYGLSLMENFDAIGVPFPKQFRAMFEQMRDRTVNIPSAEVIIKSNNTVPVQEVAKLNIDKAKTK